MSSKTSVLTDKPMDAEAWAELHTLRLAIKGPDGFATWQDAATDERIRRVKAERALAAKESEPISTQAFLAGLDMDRLYHCKEQTQARIDAIKDAGRVVVWEVSDDTINYFGTDDYPSALDALARITRQQFDKTGMPENFQLRQRRIYQAELADWLANWT
jgi:hypothetical protein